MMMMIMLMMIVQSMRILTNRELLVSSAMRRTIPMSHILDTKAKQKCMTNSTLRLSKGLLGTGDPMMGSVSMWDAKAYRSSLTFMVGMMMMMMITDYDDYDDNSDYDDDNKRC